MIIVLDKPMFPEDKIGKFPDIKTWWVSPWFLLNCNTNFLGIKKEQNENFIYRNQLHEFFIPW